MKAVFVLLAFSAIIVLASAINPRYTPPPGDHGGIRVEAQEMRRHGERERQRQYEAAYEHKIWEGKNGHVDVGAGISKVPGQRQNKHVGIVGKWKF